MKKILIQYKLSFFMILVIILMAIISPLDAQKALYISMNNFLTMLGVIPPIFILIGLMDVWIPKETMIKYMGDHSGLLGLFFAFLLGSMAAGPLYAAFPIAAMLLKKGARFAYVIFFLGTWTSAKIPLILFEMTSLGVKFTLIHVSSMLIMYLIGSFALERMLDSDERSAILEKINVISS